MFKEALNKLNKEDATVDKKIILASLQIPPPVFFCSIETSSQSEENRLSYALKCLQREDPSLRVISNDEENYGQTIIQGMGELHLDIIKERIRKEYGIDVYLGPLQIAYKEMPTEKVFESLSSEKIINAKKNSVQIEMTLVPKADYTFKSVTLIRNEENGYFNDLNDEQLDAINHGIKSALNSGKLK